MAATSRELVYQTLNFESPARAPRDLWTLPTAAWNYPDELAAIVRDYPSDFTGIGGHARETAPTQGDPHRVGEYRDQWGCVFLNIQEGVIGEVKDPLVKDWATDASRVHIPREGLTIDPDAVNRDCAATDKFTFGGCCARPFEQLQFIRGSEALYMDLAEEEPLMLKFLAQMHAFYCEQFELWAKTDVDALNFMDDWGSQRFLLISPDQWRRIFKPMYRDYAQIAHGAGKKLFMHSDGHIAAVYPDLIEIGVDAVNSQLFCMGIENLAQYAGKITFWGEICRQHILPEATLDEVREAVRCVHRNLWQNGGCIAQCEFGAAAKPENVRTVFEEWDAIFAG